MNQADGAVSQVSTPHVAFSILHAAQLIEEKIENRLAAVGLSMAKQSALSKLEEAGEPLTLSQLAEKLSCVRSNITQLVDRLEADGLVRRLADPADRRSVRAELTPQGREKQEAGAAEMAKVQAEISDRLGTMDLASLEAALGALS